MAASDDRARPASYAGYRFPAEIISFAVWLCFRFPLSLRHVDETLAARGIVVSHETMRQCPPMTGSAISSASAAITFRLNNPKAPGTGVSDLG